MSKGPFKLRSGNSPLFKKMGSAPVKDMKTGSYAHKFEEDSEETPAYLKEFGIGKGTSPYNLEEEDKGGKWKKNLEKGASTLFAGFTSALDAIYGTGKVMPEGSAKFSFSKKDDDKDDDKETTEETPSDTIKNKILS